MNNASSTPAVPGVTSSPRLDGRVVVITGGARGQGRAHAEAFAAAGADVAFCDALGTRSDVPYPLPTEADMETTVGLVEKQGRRCLARTADVADAEQMRAFMGETADQLGRIDFLIANAGIWSIAGPMWTIPESEFDAVISVNVRGAWLSCKFAIPHLLEQGAGSIVLTSSVGGKRAMPNVGHYISSKHAVIGMMKTLAMELAPHNIRVNALLPGLVNTGMIFFQDEFELFSPENPTQDGFVEKAETLMPMPGRWTEPEDQANAALWLCSPQARYVTGTELAVAGGGNL